MNDNDTIRAQAFAKINWDLRILGKRPDNFHELDSVFVNIDLSDAMTFRRADQLSMTCSDPSLPVDDSNLVIKAAKLLAREAGVQAGAAIHLDKAIPMGGGMGGGSSDAACTLAALNKLWNLGWDVARLTGLAAQVGSDVAYFLYGGWCLCRGRGEIVLRLPESERWPAVPLLMVLPPLHVATPAVYKALRADAWDGSGGRDAHVAAERVGAEIRNDSGSALELRNDLSAAAREVEPQLSKIQEVLERFLPGRWLMSGSGAAHFAVLPPGGSFNRLQELTAALNGVVAGTRVVETAVARHSDVEPNAILPLG